MKIHLTQSYIPLNALAPLQHLIDHKLNNAAKAIKRIHAQLPALTKPVLPKFKTYFSFVLNQAFRDNSLSETEMDFILITLTGSFLSAKENISRGLNDAVSKISRMANRFSKSYQA